MTPIRPSKQKWIIAILVATSLAVASGLFYLFDPAQAGFFPPCVFHKLTGLDCPGCGGQRALHQLLMGHWGAAFRFNPLLFLLLPIAAYAVANIIVKFTTGKPLPAAFNHPAWAWALVVLIVCFAIGRNLPFGPLAWLKQ